MTANFTESEVEDAALDWLAGCGWSVAHGPDIAPDAPGAERADYGAVVLEGRLRGALERLNPDLPAEALDDAFRKLTRPEGATVEARNRAFHRMVVDGVTVEHRTDDGHIRGAQVRVVDFDDPDPATTGSRSIRSPSSRTSTSGARISCCSSTGFRSG